MNSDLDMPMMKAFCEGQEKLARENAEYEARVAHEVQQESEDKSYHMTSTETAEQKLHRANMSAQINWPAKEQPLTQAERRGLSEEAFNALRPELRLQIYNQAVHARNGFVKRKRN